jgi:Domain of unknown function (DUF5606)
MDYNRLVAVTGMPGLYEVLSSKSDGAIVRSLEDKSTRFISSRIHNLSHLESIEVYTIRENVQLSDVFTAMKSSTEPLPDAKDNKALKAYFEKIYPELDFDRVYTSDMKKMVNWFRVLQQNEVDFSKKQEDTTETADDAVGEPVEAVAPAAESNEETKEAKPKKTRAKKETAESAGTPVAQAGEPEGEKPKRTRKKKTEE